MASSEKDGIVLHPAVAFPIELYTDSRIAEFDKADAELAKHAARKRPHLLAGLERLRRVVTITHAFALLPSDLEVAEKDKPIFAGAIGAGCTHLWTSDRLHFGSLYGVAMHGVLIVSSIQISDEIAKVL